jgi:beta subunit of N-acylethanolamine-hydrolyzing acid amidase/Linear amide C-N hydrolases, choloylglycine hydrolase family
MSTGDVRREPPPSYVVDLDLPPEERWAEIAAAYGSHWRAHVDQMWEQLHSTQLYGSSSSRPGAAKQAEEEEEEEEERVEEDMSEANDFASSLAAAVLHGLAAAGLGDVALELQSLARLGGVTLTDMVLLHLSYETSAACTSLVCYADGHPSIARTLDWNMTELRALTIDVEVHRGGTVLYHSTTWAGYLGVLTACKPGRFALAVNKREDANCEHALDSDDEDHLHEMAWPVCFLMRYVMENCENVKEARAELIRQP